MSLPRLSAQQPIVTAGGKPSSPFLQFMEEARKSQEATDAQQGEAIDALEAINAQLQSAVDQINEALQLAGLALETADGAAGGATRSGSSSASDDLTGSFVPITQVDLLTVSAGDLTFSGSNYILTFVPPVIGATYFFEYQIFEVDNGVDNGVVFPGSFTVYRPTAMSGNVITDTSATSFADFVDARTTTGSISYRVEARYVSGGTLSANLFFNLFARRT